MIYKIKQKHTKNTTIYIMIKAANFIWSIYLIIMSDTLLLRPSLHLNTLHPTTLNSNSLHLSTLQFLSLKLHPTTFHYPLIWLKSISISYRSISPHITTLHLTSLHPDPAFNGGIYDVTRIHHVCHVNTAMW